MSNEHYIGVIDEEAVLAECGPMRLVIRAWKKGQPQLASARQAAAEAFGYLEGIAGCRPLLSRPWPQIEDLPEDKLARRMVGSVRAIGDADLTLMAAVAGTIADAVADWLFERGATRVIVDNGGDIAIRLAEGEAATVGVRPQLTSLQISHVIHLDAGRSAWGVTTSGVGGRSFTRGIASAVTVLASNASVADSAATAIANACFVEDDGIIQLPAEKIDPNSDLAGINITTKVGPLNSEKIGLTINNAKQKAEYLSQKDIIIGAFIALGSIYTITDDMQAYILPADR
ncbi:MAG: FAD:protein FMN transferase [Deltaproteobacteria bacterium]|nr:FAD:protein FMN transferase [Deltaproteobacteria bacterium]